MSGTREIYIAGGCFWGVEKYFGKLGGVIETETGYANGGTENPSYEDVCNNNTGHAEAVRVVYDTAQISLSNLLKEFYKVIDPVSINKQGGDFGTQYRTGVYYTNAEDADIIAKSIAELQSGYAERIAVEVLPLENFYPAEEYHQKYLAKNPGGYCHIQGL